MKVCLGDNSHTTAKQVGCHAVDKGQKPLAERIYEHRRELQSCGKDTQPSILRTFGRMLGFAWLMLPKKSKHTLFNGGEQMVMNPTVESVKSPTKPKEVRVDQLGNNGS